jgi:hypothetical protein
MVTFSKRFCVGRQRQDRRHFFLKLNLMARSEGETHLEGRANESSETSVMMAAEDRVSHFTFTQDAEARCSTSTERQINGDKNA